MTISPTDLLLTKSIEIALAEVGRITSKFRSRLSGTASQVKDALTFHRSELYRWSSAASAGAMPFSRQTDEIYVDLNLSLIPRRWQFGPTEQAILTVTDLLDVQDHTVILGDPGAGKTTSLKQISRLLLIRRDHTKNAPFPIVIRLRELQHNETLPSRLLSLTGMHSNLSVKKKRIYGVVLRSLCAFLDSLEAVVLLDGLDELPPEQQASVLTSFRYFVLNTSRVRFILTCRNGDFHYTLDNCRVVELRSLTSSQIETFVRRWLRQSEAADKLLKAITTSPYHDTTVRPLTLAHLCALYERYQTIPEKPKSIYRLIVNLLLEEWDAARSVTRTLKFSRFDAERKKDFLCHLAFQLTKSTRSSTFSHSQLLYAYRSICEDYMLPVDEMKLVITEIEAHSGLLLQSGHDQFEFAHKSLQEYLAAEYIVKWPSLPNSSESEIVKLFPNEFAIAVALSSRPSDYFCGLVFGPLRVILEDMGLLRVFLARLLLEKPDFQSTPLLGIAFLSVTSKSFETAQVDGSNNSHVLFLFKAILEEIPQITRAILYLKAYYSIEQASDSIILSLTKRLGDENRLDGYELPTRMCVPSSYIKETWGWTG